MAQRTAKGVVSFVRHTIQGKVRCARADCNEIFIRDVDQKYDFDKLLEMQGWTFHWRTGWVCPVCKPTMPGMLHARFMQMHAKFRHKCEKCPPGVILVFWHPEGQIRRWRWMIAKVGEEHLGGPVLDFAQCPHCMAKLPRPFSRRGRLGHEQYYWSGKDGEKPNPTRGRRTRR